MKIFGKSIMNKFAVWHPEAELALHRWIKVVEGVNWRSHVELKGTFPSADYIGNERYVFNIKGNHIRLVAVVVFTSSALYIRYIGTHRDYDRIDCRTI
jgi:mRNA interferase HigB